MRSINPILVQFLYRSAIANLSDKKREIYQYIERKEDELEKIASNEKQFIQLMHEKSPFKEAADYFLLDISSIKEVMEEAQAEIDMMIMKRSNRMRWIDYTDVKKNSRRKKSKEWTFIFVS